MGLWGFTFDSPVSTQYSAQDKAQRRRATTSFQSSTSGSRPKRSASTSASPSKSFLSNITKRFSHQSPPWSTLASSSPNCNSQSAPAAESPFFRLPLDIRKQIYGYIVGTGETLHILLKHKPSNPAPIIGHRRCIASGKATDCVSGKCRELNILDCRYVGQFDRRAVALFLSCRKIYEEAAPILYSQNTFDFDHPLSFPVFAHRVAASSLHNMESVIFELRPHLYNFDPPTSKSSITPQNKSLTAQWQQTWEILAAMEGLQNVRVRFSKPFQAGMGWKERALMKPILNFERDLGVFEVEAPWVEGVVYEELGKGQFMLRRVGTH